MASSGKRRAAGAGAGARGRGAGRGGRVQQRQREPEQEQQDDDEEEERGEEVEDGEDLTMGEEDARRRSDDDDGDDGEDDEEEDREKIPGELLTRILHEFFEREGTRVTRDANAAVVRYVDIFVREAIARAAVERDGGFLEVSLALLSFSDPPGALS